jgi:hypothetical protein
MNMIKTRPPFFFSFYSKGEVRKWEKKYKMKKIKTCHNVFKHMVKKWEKKYKMKKIKTCRNVFKHMVKSVTDLTIETERD